MEDKEGWGLYEIARGSLTEKAKVWFYFMNSRLLPSKHVSTLYNDRAIFLYAILENYKFDVGNIIQNSLVEEDVGKSLIHLSLITQLCKDAKVVITGDEVSCPSMEPLPFPIEKRQKPPKTLVGPSRNIERLEQGGRGEENQANKEDQTGKENRAHEENKERKNKVKKRRVMRFH